MSSHNLKILFVCMGNICRSPTAEGVLKAKLQNSKLHESVHVDSAGTHNYHPNSPPDSRSQMHALKRGYDIANLRARAVNDEDFEKQNKNDAGKRDQMKEILLNWQIEYDRNVANARC